MASSAQDTSIHLSNEEYLRSHPYLSRILQAFMSELLHTHADSRPSTQEELIAFAAAYFQREAQMAQQRDLRAAMAAQAAE